ncbi:methyltransferase domain-containing protein [Vibrio wakamikoensis]|uniref:methyltransferase n=1 Tax=Vibrio wakamikoensis TaxID=2910251 RepID=UPI003D1BAB69
MDYSKLKPGDNNYRAYIGPPLQYDFMGATQFRLLCTLGLRANHKVLDLGCGSLRAGRLLISYLEPSNYHGIEPNKWLIEDAVKDQVGQDLLKIKKPCFDHNSNFNTAVFDTTFDFIIAQSIFSHTGLDLLSQALSNIKHSLNESGIALVTLIKDDKDFTGEGWVYPGCVAFTPTTIHNVISKTGLSFIELPWFHPRQTWFALSKHQKNLPTPEQLKYLTGAVLRDSEFKVSVSDNLAHAPDYAKPLPKALVITGFHRSATSATSLQLQAAGLNIGNRIMCSSISNPLGHGEDWGAVKVHDELLKQAGSSWQFNDEVNLDINIEALVPIKLYIDMRDESSISNQADTDNFLSSNSWGVKDPRLCLFLDQWDSLLGERSCYLFILRHWSASIESLQHRASRDLAHNLSVATADNPQLQFFAEPDLAAKMWLAYCTRLLAFAKQHPQKVLLVTQRALFEGAPFIAELNQRFNLQLDEQAKSVFVPSLLRDTASQSIIDNLSTPLKLQLDTVWKELLTLARFTSSDEHPKYNQSAVCSSDFKDNYKRALTSATNTEIQGLYTNSATKSEDSRFQKWKYTIGQTKDEAKLIDLFSNSGAPFTASKQELPALVQAICDLFPLAGELNFVCASFLQKHEHWQMAIDKYRTALSLGYVFPHMYMTLGQCYQALGNNSQAFHCYNQAMIKNPNNAMFFVAKASLLRKLGEKEEALELYEKALTISPVSSNVIVIFCDFLLQLDKVERVKLLLAKNEIDKDHPGLKQIQLRLDLLENIENGTKTYLSSVKQRFAGVDRYEWLAKTSGRIGYSKAEEDFLGRVEQHWIELDDN